MIVLSLIHLVGLKAATTPIDISAPPTAEQRA
jgi:hypothetical protein